MHYFVTEPLVSVVIINRNYARYVADAIQSVKDQIYRNFECLVVDNGSDDNSAAVIETAIDSDPRFSFQQLQTNLGHLGGAVWVLDRIKGEYVTFLDADDVLFPNYLVSHLQVHLSTAFSTGFTSSNSVEVNCEGKLLSGGFGPAYWNWRRGVSSLRPLAHAVRLNTVDTAAYSDLSEATRYLEPTVRGWIWCSGSANMFRRVLLERFRPEVAAGAQVLGGVDGYYIPILHAISGSNLINLPLSAYRLHGKNDYSTMPTLVNGHTGTERGITQSYAVLNLTLITLIDRCEDLPISKPIFWHVIASVSSIEALHKPFHHPAFRAALARRYLALARHFGEHVMIWQLCRLMSFRHLLEVALHGRTGWQRFTIGCRVLIIAARIAIRRELASAWRFMLRAIGRRPVQETGVAG